MSVSCLQDIITEIFSGENIDKHELLYLEKCDVQPLSFESLDLVDRDLLNEIKTIAARERDTIFFGKSLREMKCIIREENDLREHEVFVKYLSPKKLVITSVKLPYSPIQDTEYKTLVEIINIYQDYVNSLSAYFYELEKIDRFCTVVEPHNPTFKDDYRRILLDSRTWLHIEVTPTGCSSNIHLVGNSEMWQDKLQQGLISWDHDKDILENIMTVFDLAEFPTTSNKFTQSDRVPEEHTAAPTCGICLCDELPDDIGLPQPLCQNPKCGVYFHRSCLYQWLVSCPLNRPPVIGIATGACPACLKPITCSEKAS